MSRSASSIAVFARARSGSASVTPDIRRAVSTHAPIPDGLRSLVYAKPRRCSSSTRMPTPRSPRAMTLSMALSLISTEPDCASRRKISPVATPSERSAASAVSTMASFVNRSLICSISRLRRETRSRLEVSLLGAEPLVARVSLQFPADHDRRDADGRLRIGDGRPLPVLPARSRRITEVAPDHIDLAHELRTLPNERRTAERFGELAVADPVALGDLEGEVARHDIDLAAAHLLHEDAVFDRTKDRGRIGVPASDHRVRHPADREIAEGLASPVTAPRNAQLLGVFAIREVGAKDALFDEDRAVCRRAFVVHRRCPAFVGVGPIVDHCDELARDLLPDATRVDRE